MDTPIIVALIAVAATLLTNFVTAHFGWGTTQKKEGLEHKRQLIKEWRDMVGRVMTTYYADDLDEEDRYRPFRYIVQDGAFYSLKAYLSRDHYWEIENETDYHMVADMLLREVLRIEKAWGLFPVVDNS